MARLYNRQMCQNKFLFGIFLFAVFGSNSQMAPVAAGNSRIFERGTGHLFQYATTVTLNEPTESGGKDVGYRIIGDVSIAVIWQNPTDKHDKLLEVELKKPRLLIKSRKAPAPEGFVIHTSNLDSAKNSPYLIHWQSGRVIEMYMDVKEEKSIVNIKRGISSLFQFQLLDMDTTETDTSGKCVVSYKTVNPHSFTKTKTDCRALNVPLSLQKDHFLGGNVTSTRTSTYKLSKDQSHLDLISSSERHELKTILKREAGGSLTSLQTLTFINAEVKVRILKSSRLEEAVNEYEKSQKVTLGKSQITPEMLELKCEQEDCPSLPKLIRENREHLSQSNLGTLRSATAFFRVLSAAREASKDDLAKAFKGTKNKDIMAQLCDLAGAIQTPESHDVIMKILQFDNEEDFENSERYLWSLSIGSQPKEYIIKDIYKRSQSQIQNEKLHETLILTLTSMANKYYKTAQDSTIVKEVATFILDKLESCNDDVCKCKYLRALKNLKCPKTISILVHHALKGKKQVSVGAMKALRSFDSSHWTEDVIDAAQRIYFQAGRNYDSSSRTLALDILLESSPSREVLRELILSLTQGDRAYEVKQYLVQRVNQISEKCSAFSAAVNSILREEKQLLNNYNIRAQRGLTTALTRFIASNEYRNISLVSVQEIFGGFLKRGLVDVMVETQGKSTGLFRLGLFAGGLSSFVSSEDKDDTFENEEEVATAGMELDVLGTQLRPFVFFTGQGELMGHVWSGTASEKTPAYQALIVTQDQLDYIPLQNGVISHLKLLGVVSFDLSGQVQMSLWNRNAYSLVEKNAGIFLQGTISADTLFVKSKIEFNVATEVKLNLQSDLNFYNEISLCMQLSQPDSTIRHNVHKIERVPGSKHRLRKSKYKQTKVPGRTYALNRKNNEMCNLILKDK